VAISVSGGHSAGNVSSRMNVAGCGFVEMGFAFPGGGQGEARSGGTYDYRGPKCIEALRDVILFAMGKIADKQGRKIQDIAGNIHVLTSNIGLDCCTRARRASNSGTGAFTFRSTVFSRCGSLPAKLDAPLFKIQLSTSAFLGPCIAAKSAGSELSCRTGKTRVQMDDLVIRSN